MTNLEQTILAKDLTQRIILKVRIEGRLFGWFDWRLKLGKFFLLCSAKTLRCKVDIENEKDNRA
jgi:hypothetical protein